MSLTFSLRSVLLCLVIFLFLSTEIVMAQSNPSAGIGLRPATIEEPAVPGTTTNYPITVTNLSNATQTYYLFSRDIVGVENGGVPVFADENQEKTGYELTEWISLDKTELTIEGEKEAQVVITIAVPENATPGSHFGGVFVSIEPPKMRSVGASVGYEVANIISIRVAGDAVESAQIRSFATENYIYTKPIINFAARVENKGNVLIRPHGPLQIYNMFGQEVALLKFNDSKAGVFPLTTRDFSITWENDAPGFGRYQAMLSLVYGDTERATITSTATFWILPMNIILPAFSVLVILLITIYVGIKLYVRNKIALSSGVSRRIVRRKGGNNTSLLLLIAIVMLVTTALFLIILLALFA